MELLIARHLWGVTQPYQSAFSQFKTEGYAAIEAALMFSAEPKDKLTGLLAENDLKLISMILTQGQSVRDHLASLAAQVNEVKDMQPLLINVHGGRDAFTKDEAIEFYREAVKIENDVGIPIAHETHRSRVFYNPWITRDILLEIPEIKLCCDYSHWVTVCERLLNDETDILQLCARRCLHVHARVGYEQGPQVPDPRAKEYQAHVVAHEKWWDMIWEAQRHAGKAYSTLTPEFGPAPYLQTVPHSGEPVAQLEEICLWQMKRQRGRFEGAAPDFN